MKQKHSLLEGIVGKLVVTKVVCGLLCIVAAQRVHSQGFIDYNMRVSGTIVAHVYAPEVLDPTLAKMGNTASETPAGTQTYSGIWLEGSGWSAELFSALGSGQPESSLVPVPGSLTTFRTGLNLGGTIAPRGDLLIPNVPPHQIGTFQVRVWDNLGGTITSWSAAELLWRQGSIAAGKPISFDVRTGSGIVDFPAEMEGFRSFNVYFVPEPSVNALALLGGAALLVHLRRRRRLPRPPSDNS